MAATSEWPVAVPHSCCVSQYPHARVGQKELCLKHIETAFCSVRRGLGSDQTTDSLSQGIYCGKAKQKAKSLFDSDSDEDSAEAEVKRKMALLLAQVSVTSCKSRLTRWYILIVCMFCMQQYARRITGAGWVSKLRPLPRSKVVWARKQADVWVIVGQGF